MVCPSTVQTKASSLLVAADETNAFIDMAFAGWVLVRYLVPAFTGGAVSLQIDCGELPPPPPPPPHAAIPIANRVASTNLFVTCP